MKRKSLFCWIPFRFAALVAPLIAAWPQRVQAANGDWNIDNGTAWSTPSNWLGSIIGGGNAGDTVSFNFTLTAARNITLDGNRTVGTLNVNGPAAFAYGFLSNSGGSLIMDNGAGTAAINFVGGGAVAHVIQAPIVLNSNLEISSTLGSGGHQLAGNITGANGITLDSNGAHPSGTTSSVGDFIMRGYNSYSGGTTLTEARIQAYNSWSMGTGAVTVNDGGGIYMPNGGYWRNNMTLTGLGWNEGTGQLGSVRVDANSIFTGTINFAPVGAAATTRLNAHTAATTLFNGQLTGSAGVEFTSSAAVTSQWVLNNDTNNFSGNVRIGRATAAAGSSILAVGANNNSGSLGTGAITVDVGGTLAFNRSDNYQVSNNILAGTGLVTQSGLGTTTITSGSYLHAGTTSATGVNSRLIFNPGGTGGALTLNGTPGAFASSNWADLEFNASNSVNISSSVTGARGAYVFQNGTGTLTFSGTADNVNARTVVNSGTFVLGKTSSGGVHALGSRAPQYALVQNGGTVQFGGTGNDQIYFESAVRIAGGTLDLNGTSENAGTFTGGNSIITNTSASPATLDMGGFSGALGIFHDNNTVGGSTIVHAPNYSGVIQDGAGTVAITKSQPGLQILGGANTYSGVTTVNNGLLAIQGSTLSTGTVNVTGGGLAGTGSTGNIVLSNTANSSVRPGATGQDRDAVGVLNATSLTVNGGDLRLNYGAGGNDTLNLTGAANFAAASTVTPVFSSLPVAGVASNIVTGGAPAVVGVAPTVNLPANSRITGGTVAAAGNNVTLTLTGANAEAVSWAAPGTAGVWDANGALNWTSSDSRYWNLDGVTLGGAAANTAITLNSVVTPSGITDTSTGGGYTISGTGAIAGGGTLTKSGSSALTLSTANPNFTGDIRVTGGTLVAGSATALGDATGQTFVSNGGTLDINGQAIGTLGAANSISEIINISGTGVGGNGALVNNGASQLNALRFVRLTGDATVGVANAATRMDIRGSGATTANEILDLNGFTLTKTGAGSFVITEGVSVTDGNITVNQGTLSIETSAVVQGIGTITANPGSTLQYWTVPNGNVTRPNVWNGATITNLGTNSIVNSPITLTANNTLIGTGNTMTFGGNVTESGGPWGLTKNEGSTYNFAGTVAYSGATTVNGGTLTLAGLNTATSTAVNSVTLAGPATLGTALPGVQGGTGGNLNLGGGGYTTIAGAPSTVTINNGTFGINTRVSNTIGSNVVYNYFAGTNQFTINGVEQDTTTTLTGSIGNTTEYGNLAVNGGNVTLTPSSALNLRFLELNNTNGAGGTGVGTSTGTLNITGGDHRVAALFTGNASNSTGIVNMSGGTLTFENNGRATLQSTNNSGYAMFGQSGLRIGHFTNGNNVPNQFNLSGGVLDASQVTVSVGWDGAAFLNVTGGTLKALVLAVDGNAATGSPAHNRMDVSGNARIEVGWGGMPTLGNNSSLNVGDSTWVAMDSAEWTRGFNLLGNTVVDTGLNRIGLSGQMVGPGNLTKTGNGILHISGTNVHTGAITANTGYVRMGSAQAFGDGTLNTVGATLDINAQQGATTAATAYRPSTITFGGTGAPGSLGGIINSATGVGGISTDAGGSIVISGNTTAYTVGRLELGGNIANATFNNLINGGANTFTKNGQGPLIWRGTSASSIGNIVVNGGHFYAEENDNNLGSTGSITANRGGMISAWQSDTTTVQSKPVVLNGGAIMADRNSTWTGGLTLTANSKAFRSAGNADARLTFDGPLNLGGNTLTIRDRLPNPTTFTNNTSSGDGSIDIYSHTLNIGPNSTFDGTGELKIRNDALVNLDATATLTKAVNLAGGTLSDTTATARSLTVNSTGSGYLRTINAGGSMSLGTLNVLGSAATAANTRHAGMMFGSGTGYTANATPGTGMGAVSLTNNGILSNNPNFTVSGNPFLATGNDTTFAMWDGSQVTGVAPTQATIAASGPADLPMVVAAETVAASQTINNLITDATITLNAGVTLTLGGGGVILREVAAAGWSGAGALTSGRKDGVLALTMTNAYTSALALGGGDVAAFTVGNISDNTLSAAPAAFRPVTLVVNGFGNTNSVVNQGFTGGLYLNGGRINQQNFNALGLGPVTVREGGTILVNAALGVSNNISAAGLGQFEGGGHLFGALRFGGGGGMGSATGNISLDSPIVRLLASDNTTILGNVTGSNVFQRAGGGTMFVRSALSYTGATQLGTDGGGAPMGTHTVFALADGGVPSGLGASGNAASNLIFQSGTLNYVGGGATTDRLFTIAPSMTTSAPGVTIANNGFGNLSFTNPGAIVLDNGSTDATLILTANNYSQNTFTPQLTNPSGARLNLTVNGTGSWTLNGSGNNISGNVTVGAGARLILDSPTDMTIPVLTGATKAYLVKEGSNTLTLGGTGLLAEADNNTGQLMVNAGTVIFDKRGANGFTAGSAAGPGTGGTRASVLGSSGVNSGDGLLLNGGTVRYATTASHDQIFDNVDVRINGGTFDLNGNFDTFDSLNGTGGRITNGNAGTVSILGVGAQNSLPSALNFRALADYSGIIEDGAGQIELVKTGTGIQSLSGNNTYTGQTSVIGGFLRIASENNLGPAPATLNLNHLTFSGGNSTSGGGLDTVVDVTIDDPTRGVWLNSGGGTGDGNSMRPAAGTNLTFATPIRGNGGLQMVGEGTLTLSGANIYTNQTAVYRGTLALDYSSQNNSKLADGAALLLRGGNVTLNGGSHVEIVSATTVDGATGGSANAGSTYISQVSGTGRLRLNAITRNMGGTVDFQSGTAETDTGNSNTILAGANAAYATVGKDTWAVSAATAADTIITGLAAGGYAVNNFAATTNHVDVTLDSAFAAATTVSTLRFNGAATNLSLDGQTLALNQQGILIGSGAAGSSITDGSGGGTSTISGAALGAAGTTDLIVHQHSSNPFTIAVPIIPNTNNTLGLTKSGNGTLILSAANTYTGVTHLNEGTLELQGAGTVGSGAGAIWVDGTLSLNRSGAYTIPNNMGGYGTILKKDNTGVATLTGGIGTYSGGAVVSQGTLVVTGDAFANTNQINNNSANNTVYGTIIIGDANTGAADSAAFYSGKGTAGPIRKDIIVTNTPSTVNPVVGGGLPTGTLAIVQTYEGAMQLNRPTTLRANTAGTTSNAAGTAFRGTISGNVGTLTIDAPAITALANNPIGTAANNNGSVGIQATNTFVGNVEINGAMLLVGTGTSADVQDQIPDASNVTINGISSAIRAGLYLNGDSETINNLDGNANSFIAGINGASAQQLRLTVNGTGNFAGRLTGGGLTLEKAGTGTFTLSGTEDNDSGRVLVSSGTLLLAKTSGAAVHGAAVDVTVTGGTLALGGTGNDQIWDGTTVTMFGGTLDLGGTNEGIQSLFGNAGTVTNNGGGASTLTLGTSNGSSLYGGTIQDGASPVALSKTGNGGAVLTGANTYTGATNIAGGYVQIGNGGTTGSISATSGVVTSANTQLVFNRSNNVTFAPVISGAGGLVQNGSGILEIPVGTINTFTGPTVVNAGEYKVNGSAVASPVTLNPGAVLSGSGTVGSVGSNGGTIAPGNSPGILSTGSVVTNDTTVFQFEINGLTAGVSHDQINTSGIIDLDGTLVLSLGYTPVYGDKVFLWLNDGVDAITGNWTGLSEGSFIPAGGDKSWILSYNDDSAANPAGPTNNLGNDVSLYLIPEPSTALLAGAIGLLALNRRRRMV